MVYGFHDSVPSLQKKNGVTYGIPYRTLIAAGIDNLLVTDMIIISNQDAHMSTRNTESCMGQGKATVTATTLYVQKNW